MNGTVFGGRQPISGAQVYLLQATTVAYGGNNIAPASSAGNTLISLLTAFAGGAFPTTLSASGATDGDYYVTSNSGGAFSLTGEYAHCTVGSQVYVYATGGNAGAGTNTATGLMAVLGTCPPAASSPAASSSTSMKSPPSPQPMPWRASLPTRCTSAPPAQPSPPSASPTLSPTPPSSII